VRLLLVSDLHLEFHRYGGRALLDRLETDVDAIVLAGDITTKGGMYGDLWEIAKRWRRVIYVPGNHEYFGSSHEEVDRYLHMGLPKGITVLNNSVAIIDGVKFLGGTMWFPPYKQDGSKAHLQDWHSIKDFGTAVVRNREFRDLFREQCTPGTVVVTHHLPLAESINGQFRGSPLNQFFLSDMDAMLVEGRRPRLWHHGHVHHSLDYVWNGMRVVCNPFGYVGDENPAFDVAKVVEV